MDLTVEQCAPFYRVELLLEEFAERVRPETVSEVDALELVRDTCRELEPQWRRVFATMAASEWRSRTKSNGGKHIRNFADGLSRLGPARFGDVEIDSLLGDGGFAWVFLAKQAARKVAVKIPKGAETNTQYDVRLHNRRYSREAAVQFALKNPHIVDVHCHYTLTDGRCVIVMEFGDASFHSKCHGLPLPQRIVALRDIARALAYCHTINGDTSDDPVVHADLKPGNVLGFFDSSGSYTWKLADFGMAVRSWHKSQGGTPAYMSPEQLAHSNIGPASDIWSWGVILYWACTKVLPFSEANRNELVDRVLGGKYDRPATHFSEIPKELAELIARCLVREQVQRPSANELIHAVESYLRRYEAISSSPRLPANNNIELATEIHIQPSDKSMLADTRTFVSQGQSTRLRFPLDDLPLTCEPQCLSVPELRTAAAFRFGIALWEVCFESHPFQFLSQYRNKLAACASQLSLPIDCTSTQRLAGRIDKLDETERRVFQLWPDNHVSRRLKACATLGRELMQFSQSRDILLHSNRFDSACEQLAISATKSLLPQSWFCSFLEPLRHNDKTSSSQNYVLDELAPAVEKKLSIPDVVVINVLSDAEAANGLRTRLNALAIRSARYIQHSNLDNGAPALEARVVVIVHSKHWRECDAAIAQENELGKVLAQAKLPVVILALDSSPINIEAFDNCAVVPAFDRLLEQHVDVLADEIRDRLILPLAPQLGA